jgi:hypothetical protein
MMREKPNTTQGSIEMSANFIRTLIRSTRAAAALSLLALPISAYAEVEIDPGDTASGLEADGGDSEVCDDNLTVECSVSFNLEDAEVGAKVDAQQSGAGVASAELFTDFSVSDDSEAVLLGSFVSGRVDVAGLLVALAADAMASVEVSLLVNDVTAGDVLVGAQTVVSETIVNGSLPASRSSAVVIPVALKRGHEYRISLVIAAEAAGSAVEEIGAQSNFVNTASWSDLSVTAGQDPFGAIAGLDSRVSDLESDMARLILVVRKLVADLGDLEALVDRIANALRDLKETVAELREDFEAHTHTYLTGRGTGHNKVPAITTSPSDGDSIPEATPPGNSGNAPGHSGNAPGNSGNEGSDKEKDECSTWNKLRGRC